VDRRHLERDRQLTMAVLLVSPEQQFCDANGLPYAGGQLATYVMGSTTPKATWSDMAGTALNTNPIILDAAGRCLLYGDGDYRLVLRDQFGNEVWDQTASTIVSAAMLPVVSAPTLPEAARLLGVTAAVAAEASARISADTTEAGIRAAADAAELNARATADANLSTAIVAEVNGRIAADQTLQTQIDAIVNAPGLGPVVTMQTGTSITDSLGAIAVTWPAAYVTRTVTFEVYGGVTYPAAYYDKGIAGAITLTGATGDLLNLDVPSGVTQKLPNQPFTWYVTGH
jgi:hypothetical protein